MRLVNLMIILLMHFLASSSAEEFFTPENLLESLQVRSQILDDQIIRLQAEPATMDNQEILEDLISRLNKLQLQIATLYNLPLEPPITGREASSSFSEPQPSTPFDEKFVQLFNWSLFNRQKEQETSTQNLNPSGSPYSIQNSQIIQQQPDGHQQQQVSTESSSHQMDSLQPNSNTFDNFDYNSSVDNGYFVLTPTQDNTPSRPSLVNRVVSFLRPNQNQSSNLLTNTTNPIENLNQSGSAGSGLKDDELLEGLIKQRDNLDQMIMKLQATNGRQRN